MNIKKYWLIILVSCIAIGIFIIVLLFPDSTIASNKYLESVSIGLGWVLFLFQYFYAKSEKFYIRINNFRLWLTNETTKWNFSVDMVAPSTSFSTEKIWKIIKNQTDNSSKWHEDRESIIINMHGYTLRVFQSQVPGYETGFLEYGGRINIQISNLELPFRSFRNKIENEIIPLTQNIIDQIKPEKKKFVAKITFSSLNPYFGYFIRKLEIPKVVSFNCDFFESNFGDNKPVIRIRKDSLEIVANDLHAMHILSKKYIAMS